MFLELMGLKVMNEDNIQRGQNREDSYKVRRNVLIRLHVESIHQPELDRTEDD